MQHQFDRNAEAICIGIDPALRNMGLVKAVVCRRTLKIKRILEMRVVKSAVDPLANCPKNQDRFRRGVELLREMQAFCWGAALACVEVPEGAQDANAAWALGISMGIVIALSSNCTMVLVRPRDAKIITGQESTAKKEQMCRWAYYKYPSAPWLTYRGRRTKDNEHLADALAILEAGLQKKTCYPFVKRFTPLEALKWIQDAEDDTTLFNKPRRRLKLKRRRLLHIKQNG